MTALLSSTLTAPFEFWYNIFEVIIMVMKKGTQVITLRISEETKLRIEMEATRQGRSVNNFLKYIIEEYMKGEKK